MKSKRNKQSKAKLSVNDEAAKEESGSANIPSDESRLVSHCKNAIEELFERLGTPIENVTEELAGKTEIISINLIRRKG